MADAEAFLLERLGDVTGALTLFVRNIERCNHSFVEQALQGRVQLPNVLPAGNRCAGSLLHLNNQLKYCLVLMHTRHCCVYEDCDFCTVIF